MSLSGHWALITGAGQGIGRACAEVFAKNGADLILLDKNPETLALTADKIAPIGRQVVTRALDLTDVKALQQSTFWSTMPALTGPEPLPRLTPTIFWMCSEFIWWSRLC